MLPNLNELLQYHNPKVLARYEIDYPANKLSAEIAFREILKYFWLCQKHEDDKKARPDDKSLDFSSAVHLEMQDIDDMWHTFILFTRDYADFCQWHFGRFIHHFPTSDEEKFSPEEFETELNKFLSYIYDNLGEETLAIWFAECLQDES